MMYSGPYDNRSTETMYYFTDDDTQLNQLDGNSLYAVIFPKGQLPPVKGFWSLTTYDPRHFFYANDLNRYSLRFVSRIRLHWPLSPGTFSLPFRRKTCYAKEKSFVRASASLDSLQAPAFYAVSATITLTGGTAKGLRSNGRHPVSCSHRRASSSL